MHNRNPSDDTVAVIADPGLADQADLILPRWNMDEEQFDDGSTTICEAFETLAILYGISTSNDVIDKADAAQAPHRDILGNLRDENPDIGAVEMQ